MHLAAALRLVFKSRADLNDLPPRLHSSPDDQKLDVILADVSAAAELQAQLAIGGMPSERQ